MIRLRVPGMLRYRDLAVRAVAAACKLVGEEPRASNHHDFDDEVVSAFGEAFNNVALHSYRGRPAGDVEIELELSADRIVLRVIDFGHSFDLRQIADPDLDALPESGMGIFIIRSFMDEVTYEAGERNVLSMTKRLHHPASAPSAGEDVQRP